MKMGEYDGVYRYVRWTDVEQAKKEGWEMCGTDEPCHHNAYSSLMKWAGEGEPSTTESELWS